MYRHPDGIVLARDRRQVELDHRSLASSARRAAVDDESDRSNRRVIEEKLSFVVRYGDKAGTENTDRRSGKGDVLRARRSTELSQVVSQPAHARRRLHDEGLRRVRDVSSHSGPEPSALRAASWQGLRVRKHLVQDDPPARLEAPPKAGASGEAQAKPQSDVPQRVLANRRNRDPADDRHPNLPPGGHRQFQPNDSCLAGERQAELGNNARAPRGTSLAPQRTPTCSSSPTAVRRTSAR